MPATNPTMRALQVLVQQGDALTQVREIDHFAYFSTPLLRDSFVTKALAAGFKLRGTSEPYKPGAGFGAILFHKDVPDEKVLEKIIAMLSNLARQSGGEYDGWETQIIT